MCRIIRKKVLLRRNVLKFSLPDGVNIHANGQNCAIAKLNFKKKMVCGFRRLLCCFPEQLLRQIHYWLKTDNLPTIMYLRTHSSRDNKPDEPSGSQRTIQNDERKLGDRLMK